MSDLSKDSSISKEFENKSMTKTTEKKVKESIYSVGEEIFNSVTHGVGLLLSIAGMALLVARASIYGDAQLMTSYAIFGSTMIIMYLASTLHHSLTQVTGAKIFKILDHSAIFLLIAGTYTPVSIGLMRGGLGWTIFGVIWGMTVAGILMKALDVKYYSKISTAMYLIMGWMIIATFGQYKAVVPPISVVFLLSGGAAYTVGILFYSVIKYKYMHSIWHFFVLGGTICHFFSMYFAVPYNP